MYHWQKPKLIRTLVVHLAKGISTYSGPLLVPSLLLPIGFSNRHFLLAKRFAAF